MLEAHPSSCKLLRQICIAALASSIPWILQSCHYYLQQLVDPDSPQVQGNTCRLHQQHCGGTANDLKQQLLRLLISFVEYYEFHLAYYTLQLSLSKS